MGSTGAFLEAVHDFSSLPLDAIKQDPGRVDNFLTRIGGVEVLLNAFATTGDVDVDLRDDIARALKLVLSSPPGCQALISYPFISKALLTGLSHPEEFVRATSSELIATVLAMDAAKSVLTDVLLLDNVFIGLLHCMADESTAVAEHVCTIILSLGYNNMTAIERFFSRESIVIQKQLSDHNSVVHIRLLTLAAKLGSLSPSAFEHFSNSGLLDEVFDLFTARYDDPLLQMSAFAIVVEIAKSAVGLQYLVALPFGSLLNRFAPPACSSFLTTSALSMLDDITDQSALHQQFDWIAHPDLRAFLSSSMDSDNETVLEAAVGAIGAVGKCFVGLVEFTRNDKDLLFRLPIVAQRECLSTNALRIAAMHALATVFGAHFGKEYQAQGDLLRQAIICGSIDANSQSNAALMFMKTVQQSCRSVENELRVAAYRFLNEFARSRFGLKLIMATPAFIEQLLDRSLEQDAKANLWRFSVVQTVSTHQALDDAAAPGLLDRIRQHVHEGPLFKGISTEVGVL